jgi:hypothetical protein
VRRYFSSVLFCTIIAILAARAGGTSNEYFSGAPRGDDGRFTNFVGEIGHGTFAVRFP